MTSGCYVRKQQDRHLARDPIALQSTLHQCLFLCVLISSSLNFRSIKSLSEEAKRHVGLHQSGREDLVPLKAKSVSNKMSTSAEKSISLLPTVEVWEGTLSKRVFVLLCLRLGRVDAGIYRKETLRDLGGRGWGHRRAGALWSWSHGSPTGPSPHGTGRNLQLMDENPQTVGVFKIVWPPAHCPMPLGCPFWPAPPVCLANAIVYLPDP